MKRERAGIYLAERPQEVFAKQLSEKSQQRLARFLERQRAKLNRTGATMSGCAFEWEPGWAVYWDVNLKPKYRDRLTDKLASSAWPGSAYRIEVLEIRRLA